MPLFGWKPAKRCNGGEGKTCLQLGICSLDRKARIKRSQKRSKKVRKSRKKGAARVACRSGAEPKCRALHLFGKNEAKWELQKEDVRKWKHARAEETCKTVYKVERKKPYNKNSRSKEKFQKSKIYVEKRNCIW